MATPSDLLSGVIGISIAWWSSAADGWVIDGCVGGSIHDGAVNSSSDGSTSSGNYVLG